MITWILFYGRMLGMAKQEIMATRYGEMLDMVACFAIFHGAKEKPKKRKLSFLEAMELR